MQRYMPHMIAFLTLIATLTLASAAAPAAAQTQAKGTPDAAGAQSLSMGNMLGGNTVTTFDGNYELDYDQTTQQLDRLKVTKGVRVRSDNLNLDCDLLIFDQKANHMVATGEIDRPVHLKQDTVTATCQKMDYYPDDGKSVLTGNPIVKQAAGPGGNQMETRGKTITIIQKDGKMHVLVDAAPGVGGSVSTSTEQGSGGAGAPAEIDVPSVKGVNGGATAKTPSAAQTPATSKPAPVLLNPPEAGPGQRAPVVSE